MSVMKQLRWVGVALLALGFPAAGILPAWAGFENGPLEVGQVVILLGGAAIALWFAIDNHTKLRWFWLAVAIVWAILAFRELSWGGVFMPPLSKGDEGPFFSSSQLWYKPYITPALIVVGLICAAFSIEGKGIYVLRFLIVTWRFPFVDILLFIVAMIVSAGAEGHMGLNLRDWGHMQILEEMSETAAYVFLLSAQTRVKLALGR
ncbi:hypothetical protein [Agrobacterium sp.]|uniref:hypothetical protein n=1 Tax=Agrobacterium sp. TaxID=361 RepID=UPI0028AB926B